MVNKASTEDLEEKYKKRNIEVIDIREEEELSQTNKKVIPNSKHIPYSKLTQELDKINYKEEIYIICRHGNSSIMAARLLKSYEEAENSEIYSVEQGYLGWEGKLKKKKTVCCKSATPS